MNAIDSSAIESVSLSVIGQVRTENQDFCDEFAGANGSKLMVVADGMGGHRGGATASQVATRTIGEVFASSSTLDSANLLLEALAAANRRVHQMSLEDEQLQGMGTTVVALLFDANGLVWVAHVGDSRAYRLRDGGIEQLTEDHSVVGEMVRRGLITPEEASVHPHRNEILRSVGIRGDVEIDVAQVPTTPGDHFLLCSDGLTGMVTDREIASLINLEPLPRAVQSLIDLANDRGGPDNITVQIASLPAQTRPRAAVPATNEAKPHGNATETEEEGDDAPTAKVSWLPAGVAAALFVVLTIYFTWGGGQ